MVPSLLTDEQREEERQLLEKVRAKYPKIKPSIWDNEVIACISFSFVYIGWGVMHAWYSNHPRGLKKILWMPFAFLFMVLGTTYLLLRDLMYYIFRKRA